MKRIILGILAPIALLSACSSTEPIATTPTPSASASPIANSEPKSTTVYYLAVDNSSPVPEDAVPVANETTMQQLINAGKARDEAKWDLIVSSNSVDSMPGGGIVDIMQRKGELVQIRLHARSEQGEDLSGQVRWTSEIFVQERRM